MSITEAIDIISKIVFWCSVVSLLLPPIELFDNYPRFKKHYALAIQVINHYGALNLRGKIAQVYNNRRGGNGDGKQ